MKTIRSHFVCWTLVIVSSFILQSSSFADVHYVSPTGGDVSPYTNWAMAANEIQAAVDVADSGDTVLVTNGVYMTGGAAVYGANARVWINGNITVKSVNGRLHTGIIGAGPFGSNAYRCAAIAQGGKLSGFTLAQGRTPNSGISYTSKSGAGVLMYNGSAMVTDCLIKDCEAFLYGGGIYRWTGSGSGMISNCVIEANTAQNGGGIYVNGSNCTIIDCVIKTNTANGYAGIYAGGSKTVRVKDCHIVDNIASYGGGGVGLVAQTIERCLIERNHAGNYAGGVYAPDGSYSPGTVRNCLIVSNTCAGKGGGIGAIQPYIIIDNSTVVHNSANIGGGVYFHNGGTVRNSIAWWNSATTSGDNWSTAAGVSTYENACTTPEVGTDCVTNAPMFVSLTDLALQAVSPCIDAGTNLTSVTSDYENVPRPLDGDNNGTAITDIGAYEFIHAAADSDDDGLTDGDEVGTYGTNPAKVDTDGDDCSDYQEMIADTDGADGNDFFAVEQMTINSPLTVYFESSATRDYTMIMCDDLVDGTWTNVPGMGPRAGTGGSDFFQISDSNPHGNYSVRVEVP